MSFEPVTIELRTPIKHGSKEITELTFNRELKARDLRGISLDALNADSIITVASRALDVPPSVIGELAISDFMRVSQVVSGFFDDSPLTGGIT